MMARAGHGLESCRKEQEISLERLFALRCMQWNDVLLACVWQRYVHISYIFLLYEKIVSVTI